MRFRTFYWLLLSVSLTLFSKVAFSSVLDITQLDNKSAVKLVEQVRYASEDVCPEYNFKSIGRCDQLQIAKQHSPNFGFNSVPHWFVFSLANPSQYDKTVYVEVAYALLDNIEFTALNEAGQTVQRYVTGDAIPFEQRPIKSPNFVFPVTIAAQQKIDIQLKVDTQSSLQVPILIWQPEGFVASKFTRLLLFGLLIGSMVVMAIYNLVLSVSMRDKSYFYCASMLLGYAIVQSNLIGLSYAFLWPNSPFWNQISLPIIDALTLAFLAIFAQTFLPMKNESIHTNNALQLSAIISFTFSFLIPFIPYYYSIVGIAILASVIPFIAFLKSIQLWRHGHDSARYFLLSFLFFFVATLLYLGSKFGLLPMNLITEHSIHLGAVVTVIFLSLAIASQTNQDRYDKEAAQAESIESLKRFQKIYTRSNEGLFEIDSTGCFTAVNPAFLSILGASSLHHLIQQHPNIESILVDNTIGLLEKIQAQDTTTNFDLRCFRMDSSEIWISINTRLNRDNHGQIMGIEGSIIDVSERKNAENKLNYLANYDQLTGLINRNAFQERLQRLIDRAHETQSENAMLFIDLDRFKLVNDTCGHLAGDELLRQLSGVLTYQVRQRDTTSRIGGDEFAILLENCDINKAMEVGNELKERINKFHFSWQGKKFDIGASIGIVPINQYSESVVSLLNMADTACLTAKEQGRNRIIVHNENTEDIRQKVQAKVLLSTLNESIENNKFLLYKQKFLSLKDPQQSIYEVLLRLDLNGDTISPGAFIPTAERYNVMPRIDRWVIKEFLAYLNRDPKNLANIHMATVNLSGQTLSNPDFLPFLIGLLEEHPEVSKKLCFELTESAALSNLSESCELITKIKALGAKFAVDDFGSGYASYSYLTQLPIDFVKIDGTFCLNIDKDAINQTVVRSITEISHIMGMKVIAEYVETEAAMDCLREIGVDIIQGYYFDQPSPL